MIVVIRPAVGAVITLTFANYLCQPILNALCIPNDDVEYAIKATAILALGIITYINVCSVKVYLHVQNIFGCFKVITCLIVIAGGIYYTAIGNTENLSSGFEGTTRSPKDLALAVYSGLWAYNGWASVTMVTEEIKKPEINILRSILVAVPTVTVLYVLVNISYMIVLTNEEMVNSQAVAVTFGEQVLSSFAFVIPLGVAISTFGCALSLQFGVARICYVSGQDGFMLECLSYVHYTKLTPSPAIVLQGIGSFLLILTGDIIELIQFVTFLTWMFYGIAMVSLLILRKTAKKVPRTYKVPILIPIFILLIAIYLSLTPIIMDPSLKYLIALGSILIGVLLYYCFVYKNKRPEKFMRGLNYYVQVIFEAVPPENTE